MGPPLLIAASPGGARELAAAFDRHADYSVAQSFEEALELLKQGKFAAIVVGYYFDQAQPFRFISEAQLEHPKVPIVLVRPLPIPLGTPGEEIRSAYRQLGVGEFFDLQDAAQRSGVDEARRRLRETVFRLIGP